MSTVWLIIGFAMLFSIIIAVAFGKAAAKADNVLIDKESKLDASQREDAFRQLEQQALNMQNFDHPSRKNADLVTK